MIIAYVFTGEEQRDGDGRYIIPSDATHVSVHESVKVIPQRLFCHHPNIVELICHEGVITIEEWAFWKCPSLRRVIIRGVKVVEWGAFQSCAALEYVECPELERIGAYAFANCKSLSDINLTSVKIVEEEAFSNCEALVEATFGSNLEFLESRAFLNCPSLESITIPLKYGLLPNDDASYDTFIECANLKWVDLVEETILDETVAALLLNEWRNDMNGTIDSINNWLLPLASAGKYDEDDYDVGEKAITIGQWISRVLCKISDYKAKHRRLVNEAASALQLALPDDIVTNDVVPFLELPLHTFDREDEDDGEESGVTFPFRLAGEEEKDGENNNAEVHNASADDGGDEEHQQQDGEGGRKRRKTEIDDDTERVDD